MNAILRRVKRSVLKPRKDPLPELLSQSLLLEVAPSTIVWFGPAPADRRKGTYLHSFYRRRNSFILGGTWDKDCTPVTELETYQFIRELIAANLDYTQCSRFNHLMDRVKRQDRIVYKNKDRTIQSESDVHAYLQSYVDACRSMRERGYRPEMAKDQICVMVGRRGDLIKEIKGLHRLCIAQLLRLPRVVVQVRHVHSLWVKGQRKRFGRMAVDELLRRALRELEEEKRAPSFSTSEAA